MKVDTDKQTQKELSQPQRTPRTREMGPGERLLRVETQPKLANQEGGLLSNKISQFESLCLGLCSLPGEATRGVTVLYRR